MKEHAFSFSYLDPNNNISMAKFGLNALQCTVPVKAHVQCLQNGEPELALKSVAQKKTVGTSKKANVIQVKSLMRE